MFRGKQPRQARFDPRRHPVRLAMPLSVADRQVIEVRERLALAEVEAGRTMPQARRELLLAAGLCWSLALRGIGPEAEPLAAAALGAISREAPDASVLRAMLDALDQQRRIATRGELIDAAKDAQQLARAVAGRTPERGTSEAISSTSPPAVADCRPGGGPWHEDPGAAKEPRSGNP